MSLKKLDSLITKLEHTKSKIHSGGDIKDFVGGARRRRRVVRTVTHTHRRRPIGSGLTGGFTLPKLKRLITEILKHEMHKKGGVVHHVIRHLKTIHHPVRISKYAPRQARPVVLGSGRRKVHHAGAIQDFTGSGLTGGRRHYTRRRRSIHAGTIQDFTGEGLTGGRRRRRTYKKHTSRKGGAVPAHLNAWTSHVQDVRHAHPNLSFKEALQVAKKSYR